jgi:hypothetical protein
MVDKRVTRRLRIGQPVGGLSGALSRRRGLPDTAPAAVEEEDDTPVLSLLKKVPRVSQSFRNSDNVHVSDLISKCIRKIAIMRRMGMAHPQESLGEGQGVTYAIGDALHSYVVGRMTKGHPEMVYAKWSCACGISSCISTFARRSPKTCPTCATGVVHHSEAPFCDKEKKLIGRPDLLLYESRFAAFRIVEIKSMAAEQWKELVRPLPDHKIQVALYWRLMQACNMPVTSGTSILYVNKEMSFKLPYKEFYVPAGDVKLDGYYAELDELNAASDGGPLPRRVCCVSVDSSTAKDCPVRVLCFGSD